MIYDDLNLRDLNYGGGFDSDNLQSFLCFALIVPL